MTEILSSDGRIYAVSDDGIFITISSVVKKINYFATESRYSAGVTPVSLRKISVK